MIKSLISILLVLCTTFLHAQSLTQSVKDHIMRMTVVNARELVDEISVNRIKLNKHFENIKEGGGHPFLMLRGEIKDMRELKTGCKIELGAEGKYYTFHLYSALDEDIYTYSTGDYIYAFISPSLLSKYDSYFNIAILSKTKAGLAEKIAAIVHGITDYPNNNGLLKHLLDVQSSTFDQIGVDYSINALIRYFGLGSK